MPDAFTLATLASSNFDDAANWSGTGVVNSSFQWTSSGSGTGEYYLELSGGGDPSVSQPGEVRAEGTALTGGGTLGSLAAGSWGYGDNDTLGFSTVYVRLADGADPDTKNADHVTIASIAAANDDVYFQFDASVSMDGGPHAGIEYDDIYVLASCTGNIGSAENYLRLDQGTSNKVVFAGRGTAYIDMGSSASNSVLVTQTKSASNGQAGLYFKNDTSSITKFEVNSGVVRLVNARLGTLVVRTGAAVYIDPESTITTIICDGGTIVDYGATITTWKHNGGTGTKLGTDAFAILMYGGTFYNDGTGTATLTMYGGLFDSERNTEAKNLTYTIYGGEILTAPTVTATGTQNTSVSITSI